MPWKNKYIGASKFTRPTTKLQAVRKIVLHYTANNGGTANGHYNYFRNLIGRYASAHIFVDKIEALCIIPLNEVAYHANDGAIKGVAELRPNANFLSIGVEMCMEKDGSFHPNMIERTEDVVAELCKMYNLNPLTDVVRHYDVTRKNCPAPWVSNSSLFSGFKNRVNAKLKKPEAEVTQVSNPVVNRNAKDHIVAKGETFYSISKQYGLTLDEIQKYNARVKPNELRVGDVIHLVPFAEAEVGKPVVKPAPKPVAKPKSIGSVVITTAVLNIRKSSDLSSAVVGKSIKGSKFDVYEVKNGMLKIDENKWISASDKFSKYTSNTAPKPKPVVKPTPAKKAVGKVVIETAVLNIRNSADVGSKIVGKAVKGNKFDVYEVKNSMLKIGENRWISAVAKYSKYTPVTKLKAPLLTYSGHLGKGSKGSHVKALQNALNALNFKVGTADGNFDAKTEDAVRRFQSVYLSREVDGYAGQNTKNKINELLR